MVGSNGCSKQHLLRRFVAASIINSSYSLSNLQDKTGLHRSKLGRMRQGKYAITFEEAEIVLRALGKPVRAVFMLACLGDDYEITPEGLAYLDRFMEGLPTFIEHLNALGSALNPKWANGSIHCLASLIVEQADRCTEANIFRSPYPR